MSCGRTRKRSVSSLVLLLVFKATIFLSACNNGNGSSDVDAKNQYAFYETGYFTEGYFRTALLTGNDSLGNEYTGAYTIETLARSEIDGQTVIPVQTTLELIQTADNTDEAITQTTYYTADAEQEPIKITDDRGFTWITAKKETESETGTFSRLPQTAQIGDSGYLTTYEGPGHLTLEGSWELTRMEGAPNHGQLITSTDVTYEGTSFYSTTHSLEIDSAGVPYTISIEITVSATIDAPEITQTFNGSFRQTG